MFPPDFKEQVRSATDLVQLVGDSIALTPQRGGLEYVGLCPFHDDHDPSFRVYPDRQSYRCWVCEEGGDCFSWVQAIERVSFREAIELLARRARIDLPKSLSRRIDPAAENSRARLFEAVDWATEQFHRCLLHDPAAKPAREYAESRGLSQETLEAFRIGYHPENWTWLMDRARDRFSTKILADAALIAPNKSGQGHYDNLVGRFIFPIFDREGRAVAFGGRVLPGSNFEDGAKYWNSPESAVFRKSHLLYAFSVARDAIRRSKTAVVVEGYMDCVACHQAGVHNVVAALGTAFTADHARMLKRFVDKVVMIFDGDEAGQRSSERAIGRMMAEDIDMRILTLPAGQDPADFVAEHSGDALDERIRSAMEAWEYKLLRSTARHGIDSVGGREQVLTEMVGLLAEAPRMKPVREDLIVRNVAWRLRTDESLIRQQLNQTRKLRSSASARNDSFRRQREEQQSSDSQVSDSSGELFGLQPEFIPPEQLRAPTVHTGTERVEREILEIILTVPDYADAVRHHIGTDDFAHAGFRRLFQLCTDILDEGVLPNLENLIGSATDAHQISLINSVADSAREKDLLSLLSEQDATQPNLPLHLQRVLRPMKHRRAERDQQVSKQQIALNGEHSSEFNNDTKDALRRIYELRQKQMGQSPR